MLESKQHAHGHKHEQHEMMHQCKTKSKEPKCTKCSRRQL